MGGDYDAPLTDGDRVHTLPESPRPTPRFGWTSTAAGGMLSGLGAALPGGTRRRARDGTPDRRRRMVSTLRLQSVGRHAVRTCRPGVTTALPDLLEAGPDARRS